MIHMQQAERLRTPPNARMVALDLVLEIQIKCKAVSVIPLVLHHLNHRRSETEAIELTATVGGATAAVHVHVARRRTAVFRA